jgi:hypothetical protein
MNDARLQCVIDSLSLFGENSKAAIMSQLDNEGISFTSEGFEIRKFCKVVNGYLGQWSDFIFSKITDNICEQSGVTLENLGLDKRAKHIESSELLIELFTKVEALQHIGRRVTN